MAKKKASKKSSKKAPIKKGAKKSSKKGAKKKASKKSSKKALTKKGAKKKASKKRTSTKTAAIPAKKTRTYEGPMVWVGAYGAYNEGNLVGAWIDSSDPDTLQDGLDALMLQHPQYEEWGVFDFQLMPGYDGESVQQAVAWAERNAEFEDKAGYLSDDAKAAVLEYMSDVRADLDDALEAFTGIKGDEEDLARDWVESIGSLKEALGDKVTQYFDYDSFARDLEMGGDVTTMVTEDGEFLVAWSGDLADPEDPDDDAWVSGYRDIGEYAQQLLDDIGISADNAETYFDWESFGRDLSHDHSQYNGYWFRDM